MKTFAEADISQLEKSYRTALINSLSGAKGANLIGTKSMGGDENLALFSSVVHLGANPPLLGLIMRPLNVERHTYTNILETEHFSVNAVSVDFQQKAHQCSARYPAGVSEFEAVGLRPHYHDGFQAPFVGESPLHIGCRLEDDIEVPANGTRLLVGRIVLLAANDNLVQSDGYLDIASCNIAAISGLDAWHNLGTATRYSHARPGQDLHLIKP
jgi:flavin reductase (DIM6/NTAB) family NADH-FMN oxidoreductase RutF